MTGVFILVEILTRQAGRKVSRAIDEGDRNIVSALYSHEFSGERALNADRNGKAVMQQGPVDLFSDYVFAGHGRSVSYSIA